jgi:hypothetical protein
VKCYATELGVNLLFIPLGLTDELQPLDRFVFGLTRANCRRLYHPHVTELSTMNKQTTFVFLVWAWEAGRSEVLNDALAFYEDFDQSEDWDEKSKSHFSIMVLQIIEVWWKDVYFFARSDCISLSSRFSVSLQCMRFMILSSFCHFIFLLSFFVALKSLSFTCLHFIDNRCFIHCSFSLDFCDLNGL